MFRAAFLSGLAFFAGCGAQPAHKIQPLPKTFLSTQCYVSQSDVNIWLEQESEWQQLPEQTRNEFSQASIDWTRERILLISEGQKPSAGYSLKLENWLLEQNYWQATKLQRSPAPGTLQAQMITSPCLLVVIPKSVKSFTLNDVSGNELGRWPY